MPSTAPNRARLLQSFPDGASLIQIIKLRRRGFHREQDIWYEVDPLTTDQQMWSVVKKVLS
ncbi:MAG: hypothetical protein GY758_08895 [Fuerstiella sp.]|nr:hypothetical protein [Fuerstiella sp.]MCP4510990.1 hypothetical protein [Fuerstiella sp.]MDG2128536.1 hypothetical protein [Fuerstiella sp.]